jgi:NAD(P)H dehydrogenase (quinone)
MEVKMFAITGITGKVGGATARALLASGHQIRAVVRSADRGAPWAERGCEVAVADMNDARALAKAFSGVEGVFLMSPPDFDPAPGFPEVSARLKSVRDALLAARPGKLVMLSTVGGHVDEPSLLHNSKMMEEGLRDLPMPIAFLRAAWFMENAAWDVAAAKAGVIPSFLQPLDHMIPMVSTADIGHAAAELLRERWTGLRIVELEGPRRYSANDIATGFARALGHPVRMEPVPRESWEARFRSEGMKNPAPRMRMVDGFNEGWIDFEGGKAEHRTGATTLDTVLNELAKG